MIATPVRLAPQQRRTLIWPVLGLIVLAACALAAVGLASTEIGAGGVVVDVHPHPEVALCDGPESLDGTALRELASAVRKLPPLVGRGARPGRGTSARAA